MEAIVDSFPSIREERPVDTPAGRERAAFFGVRRDDRRDMLQCWYNAMIHIIGVVPWRRSIFCVENPPGGIFGTSSTVFWST